MKSVWKTAEGHSVRVEHMSDEHIYNALKWILDDDQVSLDDSLNDHTVAFWIFEFVREMYDRKIDPKTGEPL